MSNDLTRSLSSLGLLLKDGCIVIDNSSLEKWVICPRLFEYTRLLRRIPAEERIALKFGGAIHKALEVRYSGADIDDFSEEAMLSALEKEFLKFETPQDDYRTFDYGSLVIEKYNVKYAQESVRVLDMPGGRKACELPFAFQLGVVDGIPIIYVGKIDAIVEDALGVCILDHKTSSVLGPTWWLGESVSPQYDGYAVAVERCAGIRTSGVLINALGVRKPTKTGTAIEFAREFVQIDERRKEEWIENTLHIVSRIYRDAQQGYFPMIRKNCTVKYGTCSHYEVCSIPADNRHVLLNSSSFMDDTWSPLDPIHENATATLIPELSQKARSAIDLPAR